MLKIYAHTMPPKAKRGFTVNTATGEVRCKDPSCQVTQCGQCNIEQNTRKRAARKLKNQTAAAMHKAAEDQAVFEQVSAALAAGKTHEWTFDVEGEKEGEEVMARLEASDSEPAENKEDLANGGKRRKRSSCSPEDTAQARATHTLPRDVHGACWEYFEVIEGRAAARERGPMIGGALHIRACACPSRSGL
jgi:hypothetical protein